MPMCRYQLIQNEDIWLLATWPHQKHLQFVGVRPQIQQLSFDSNTSKKFGFRISIPFRIARLAGSSRVAQTVLVCPIHINQAQSLYDDT